MTKNPEIPDRSFTVRSSNTTDWQLDKKVSASGRSPSPVSRTSGRLAPPQSPFGDSVPETPDLPGSRLPSKKRQKKRFGWLTSFKFWAAGTIIISGSLGFTAITLMLGTSKLPNCPAIYWPLAPASARVYCATLAANKDTVDDLLEAIALVDSLPPDHPLRGQINAYVEQWSQEILKIAENSYQDGKIDEAIATARKIPTNVSAYKLVQNKIENWQAIWSQAEDIYQQGEEQLRQLHWHDAFTAAVKLTNLPNKYWSTTKYEELVNLLQLTQAESNKLFKGTQLAQSGGVDNLLEAVKIAQSIGSNSYLHQKAQDLLAECGKNLLELAQNLLDQGKWQKVLEIAQKMPVTLNLQAETQDLNDLANAYANASDGTTTSLEQAIALAQKFEPTRPLYNKAQQLINRWQLEIQDVAHLQRSRELASPGNLNDLRAAIAEAELIPASNPRGTEAQNEISSWTRQVETIEDQPIIDRAQQLSSGGDMASLQNAIQEASLIHRGRALYSEAQSQIQHWTEQIQRWQDQPYLDEAQSQANAGNISKAITIADNIRQGRVLYPEAQSQIQHWRDKLERLQDQPYLEQAEAQANVGNLRGAVETAKQIKSGRALSGAAHEKIRTWQKQLEAQDNLQSANQLANSGSPEALAQAIRLAKQVPASSPQGAEAKDAINRWSNQLLFIAQQRAQSDLPSALAIAKSIPPGTEAYDSAQQLIGAWQNSPRPPILNKN